MRVATSELTGTALDWAVTKALGSSLDYDEVMGDFWVEPDCVKLSERRYSTAWAQGGPIIEREKIELRPGLYHSELWAAWGQTQHGERNSQQGKTGPTPLVAAMRCYVAAKLGEHVDVPDTITTETTC